MSVRAATLNDLDAIAHGLVEITTTIAARASDPYSQQLPTQVNQDLLDYAATFVGRAEAQCYVFEAEGANIAGGILVHASESSMPVAMKQPVAVVTACWVEPSFRRRGIARALLAEAERWCMTQGLDRLELSYMEQNGLAAEAWARLGFAPFRVFAFKDI